MKKRFDSIDRNTTVMILPKELTMEISNRITTRENQVLKFFDNRYEKKYSKRCVGASR